MTSSWFFLSALNYDARSTTHHINLSILKPVSYSYINLLTGIVSAATCCAPYFVPMTYEYLIVPIHIRRERFVTPTTLFPFKCFAQLKLNSHCVTVAFSYAFSFRFISLLLPIFPLLPSCLRLALKYIYLISVC